MGQRIYESCSTHLLQSESELEKSFWLRASKTHGTFDCVDSQRQIGPYRADAYFEINGHRLVIELDGSQHGTNDGKEYDAERTKFLEALGLKVLRYWNHNCFRIA
jgi:very-short-patch-repair endonuclease